MCKVVQSGKNQLRSRKYDRKYSVRFTVHSYDHLDTNLNNYTNDIKNLKQHYIQFHLCLFI